MSQSIPDVKDRLQYKYHVELHYFLIIRAADVQIKRYNIVKMEGLKEKGLECVCSLGICERNKRVIE